MSGVLESRQFCRLGGQEALAPEPGARGSRLHGRDAEGACREPVPGAAGKYVASLAFYGALRADLDRRYHGSRRPRNVAYTPSEGVGFFGLTSY